MIIGELVDLGLAEIRTGPFGTQLHASDYVKAGRPVLNVRNVGLGDVRPDKLEFVNEGTAGRLAGHVLRSGDIIFGRKGAVERHAIISDAYVGSLQGSDCIRLRVLDGAPVRASFVSFALRTREHQAWMKSYCAHGATMASLNQEILRKIRLPDLDLKSQDCVTSVLQAFDDLIGNNRRRIELLEKMAQAIYREWFVNFRYPGHEHATLVDSLLGPIPDGWGVKSLGDVALVNRESRKPGATEVIRYLDISCLGDRKVETPIEMVGSEAPGRARRVVRAGDIALSMVRPNRRAHALLVQPGNDWVASTGLAVLTPRTLAPSLLFETVSAQEFTDYLVSKEGGAAYPAVKPGEIAAALLVIPPLEIERAFDSAVQPIHSLVWALQSESVKLAQTRDLLLPKLVTGQIDVSNLDRDSLVESVA